MATSKPHRLVFAIALLALSACSSAGPFVTSISSDGNGNLLIEKNSVYMNPFFGTIFMGSKPTTQTIRVADLPRAEPPVLPQVEKR